MRNHFQFSKCVIACSDERILCSKSPPIWKRLPLESGLKARLEWTQLVVISSVRTEIASRCVDSPQPHQLHLRTLAMHLCGHNISIASIRWWSFFVHLDWIFLYWVVVVSALCLTSSRLVLRLESKLSPL